VRPGRLPVTLNADKIMIVLYQYDGVVGCKFARIIDLMDRLEDGWP